MPARSDTMPCGLEWGVVLEQFDRFNRRLEAHSVDYYHYQLVVLKKWVTEKNISLEEFDADHMGEFLSIRKTTNYPSVDSRGRKRKPASAKTRRHDYDCAHSFFQFCVDRDYLPTHPFYNQKGKALVKKPSKEDPLLKTPDHAELHILLNVVAQTWTPFDANGNPLPPPPGWKSTSKRINVHKHPAKYTSPELCNFYRTRDTAILRGLICGGMRSGELLALTMDDYEPHFKMNIDGRIVSAPRVLIRESKNDTPRIVYMRPDWVKSVKEWLRAREQAFTYLARKGKRYTVSNTLFVDDEGKEQDSDWWGHIFAKYRRLACQKGYRTHDIRHRAGVDAYQKNPAFAKEKLGHRSITTTIDLYGHREESWMVKMSEDVDTLAQVLRRNPK